MFSTKIPDTKRPGFLQQPTLPPYVHHTLCSRVVLKVLLLSCGEGRTAQVQAPLNIFHVPQRVAAYDKARALGRCSKHTHVLYDLAGLHWLKSLLPHSD